LTWVAFGGADVPLTAIRLPAGTVAFLSGNFIDSRLADPLRIAPTLGGLTLVGGAVIGCDGGCELVLWGVGWILNVYTLDILSLIGNLLVAVSTPYLKVIVALVIPGAMALYVMPERFGLNIGDCPLGFRVTCCALQGAVAVWGCIMTFLLNVIESGEVQVPLTNVIVAVELLNTMPLRLRVLPTATFDGMIWTRKTFTPLTWWAELPVVLVGALWIVLRLPLLLFLTAKAGPAKIEAVISSKLIVAMMIDSAHPAFKVAITTNKISSIYNL
jgi:hypothetical protein